MFNILFVSAGRRVELLRAFRRAYDSLDLAGHIVAIDIDPLAPALQTADRYYLVPPLTDPNFMPKLAEICRSENVGLIFPLIDPDIPVLSDNKSAIEAIGTRVVVVSTEAATITSDKWLTTKFFERLGLATPRSWLPDQLASNQKEFPLFIKPRRGSGSQMTFKIRNEHELAFFLGYVPDPIIQEYLPGPEITTDVICDLEGNLLAVSSRQRIEVRWGEVSKGITIYDPAISQACAQIARALPAVGPVTVQCMMKGGRPCFTEINARFGGGIPLAFAAGVDAPLWLLANSIGLNVPIPPLGSYQTGLYLTRCDESLFLSDSEFKLPDAQPQLLSSRRDERVSAA